MCSFFDFFLFLHVMCCSIHMIAHVYVHVPAPRIKQPAIEPMVYVSSLTLAVIERFPSSSATDLIPVTLA